ncbi:hypothetical protein D3C80_1743310 [compost metagenome]
MRAIGVVIVPAGQGRNIDTQLVVVDPADVIKQIIISRETETCTAVKTVGFVVFHAVLELELWTNTAADLEVQAAQRIVRLWILFNQGDFCVCSKRR